MLSIRTMESADLDAVASIEKENFTRPWSRKSLEDSAFRKDTLYFVAEQDGSIAGYIGMWISLDEGEITNVSVAKNMQGQGIGSLLMGHLLREAEKRQIRLCILEVRKSNHPAIRLYERAGFVSMGVRKNFYEAPKEDGLVMGKQLSEGL